MNKRILIIIFGVILLAGAIYLVFALINKDKQVVCTQEAKICPDGSAVGRIGPNCEFAPCPDKTATGIIEGKVIVGPICPVERPGVPCPVPPEAYTSREIILYAANGTTIVKRMHFAPDGTYYFEVSAGTYILDIPQPAIGSSKDLPKTLNVKSGETIEFNFSIDTGIR